MQPTFDNRAENFNIRFIFILTSQCELLIGFSILFICIKAVNVLYDKAVQ